MSMLFPDDALPRASREIAPGAVHIPGFLSLEEQAWIVGQYRQWRAGPVPPHHPIISGHPMSVESLCLGLHWTQGGYSERAEALGGRRVLPVPDWTVRLARRAADEAQALTAADLLPDGAFAPDMLLANYYAPGAVMGLHQDAHEETRAPIVSLSLGDSCLFRLGGSEHRGQPWQDVRLVSGDLLVFGGPARFAFHGVPKVFPGTSPAGIGLSPDDGGPGGRINLTVRQVRPVRQETSTMQSTPL